MTTTDRPLHELPPVCPEWLSCGWCVLPEGHGGGHLPLPVSYPPVPTTVRAVPLEDRTAEGLLSILNGTVGRPFAGGQKIRYPRHDGGPSVTEFLRSKGER